MCIGDDTMRILIAEDEVGIAKALKLVLEKNRFAVDMVHNGLDALEYMLSVSYDAVVLDICLLYTSPSPRDTR